MLLNELFEKTQNILFNNRMDKKCGMKSNSHSILAGKIFDDKNNKMTPSHSNTRKRKYRYYVSQPSLKDSKSESGSVDKIPAGEVEKFVTETIKEFLTNTKEIQKYIKDFDVTKQKEILKAIKNIENFAEESSPGTFK